VIRRLQDQHSAKSGLAYFFFDARGGDQNRSLYTALLSLVSQLFNQCQGIPQSLVNYANNTEKPVLDDLLKIFQILLEMFTETYILIDALDECPQQERKKVIGWIKEFQSYERHSLHIMITGRRESDIIYHLQDFTAHDQIPLHELVENNDIHAYIDGFIDNDPYLQKFDKAMDSHIRIALKAQACGM